MAKSARGNLTSAGTTSYGYDSDNLLQSASGGSSAALSYDPFNRLYQVIGASTVRFAYDGDAEVGEYDGGNALLSRVIQGPGSDEPLVVYTGAGTSAKLWLHADERGSITASSDSAGNLTGAIDAYDEYGIPQSTNSGRERDRKICWSRPRCSGS